MTLQRYKLLELASRFGGDVGVYLSDEAEKEIANLEAENDRLRGGLEAINSLRERTAPGLAAENERLRAALCDRHKQGCRLLSILNPGPCDCGLEELDDGISNYIGDE